MPECSVARVTQLARLALLVAFAALGIRVRRARGAQARRAAVHALLAYTLAVHGLAAATGADVWPFSAYPQMAVDVSDHETTYSVLELKGIDEDGREWNVEPGAFS